MPIYRADAEFEDSSVPLRARVLRADESGDMAQQADIVSIVLSVYDLANPRKAIATVNVSIAECVFNQPQHWERDAVGHNFRFALTPAMLPQGGRTYRVDVRFTFANGHVRHAVWEVPTVDLKRS